MVDSDSVPDGGYDGESSYTVHRDAQLKILLHAAKHLYAEVNGVLIGTSKTGVVQVVDAIPLFHTPMFAPMLETSFALVEEYCKSNQTPEGTRIVGWYNGPNRSNFSGVPDAATRVTNLIRSKYPDLNACILLVDTNALADPKQPGVKVYQRTKTNANWTASTNMKIKDEKASKEFSEMLLKDKHQLLHDFDNWLEDTSCDWRNLGLF
uniref:MPN domain-containing protein n=2 Tax=Mucochytrium quahogii TaxID=96639 RepID=A0A7S2S590_9STRA|mmetsp:Transcript_4456/g.6671  ORF Transcript_4456/g.6671 Transcript_4456/m.6671 type:complete len:208 (+) Transcript_4456:45-668(+)